MHEFVQQETDLLVAEVATQFSFLWEKEKGVVSLSEDLEWPWGFTACGIQGNGTWEPISSELLTIQICAILSSEPYIDTFAAYLT